MSSNTSRTDSYSNPVYAEYFADPFVWKHERRWYAVGTGAAESWSGAVGEKVIPLLVSDDFVSWRKLDNALVRPPHSLGHSFWAPEIAYDGDKFYLYYSVGHEDRGHQLRVAVSETPEGPYIDTGDPLVDPAKCPFAIDPHAFRDDDGSWYLFYARDFLDATVDARAGTALMVDRLDGMTRLAGDPRVVLRARFDWHRFQKGRPMYGQVFDWHTLEGPCVRKHDGKYYCFYSGGRWETDSYGVDYGIADHVLGPYAHPSACEMPRVLRTVPETILGPGHNSIVVGPDGKTEYVVYHAWDPARTMRRMCLDRLEWTSDGPRCLGPTSGPQRL